MSMLLHKSMVALNSLRVIYLPGCYLLKCLQYEKLNSWYALHVVHTSIEKF